MEITGVNDVYLIPASVHHINRLVYLAVGPMVLSNTFAAIFKGYC